MACYDAAQHGSKQPEFLERFRREAKAAAGRLRRLLALPCVGFSVLTLPAASICFALLYFRARQAQGETPAAILASLERQVRAGARGLPAS